MGMFNKRRASIEKHRADIEVAHPERVTSREYYGAVLGVRFDDDLAAAQHYLADGWREGVLPHPFLDRPMVRSSMDAAVRLRDELREFGHDTDARPRLGRLTGIVDASAMRDAGKGRWVDDAAEFLVLSTSERDAMIVRGGMRWGKLRQVLDEATHVVPRIHAAGMFDVERYAGDRVFLGWRAALDDYLVEGENKGLIPNWAFEPEWHATQDRGQNRGPRAFNQLFQYVFGGERTHATPLDAGDRSLAELVKMGDDEILAPVGGGQTDVRSARAAAYAAQPGAIELQQGARVPLRGGESLDVAVIVDARHLVADSHLDELRALARTQNVTHRAIFVVCDADDGHEPPLCTRLDEERLQFVYSALGQPLGEVAAELVEEGGFPAWTLWRPGQQWKPDALSDLTRALDANPDAAAVGAYTPHAPQEWAVLEGALWRSRLDAAGIVFRSERIAPDPRCDYGLNADAVVRLAIAGDGIVVEGDRFWARAYDANVHANRAGANSARKRHMPEIECTVPSNVRATVAIPTFQDWRMTLNAVRAVRAADDIGVIVIDNGSRRAVGAILSEAFLSDPHVQYVRLPSNADFAVASDLGARIATSDAVVFLNNDTVVQDGWIDGLLEALPSAAAVQPVLLFADRTVQSAGTVFAGGLSMPRHLLSGFHLEDVPRAVDDYEFSALTAACLVVDRQDYLDAGGFDAEYVNGMEDVDLCLRLKERTGRPLRVSVGSTVVHLESKTPGRFAHAFQNRHRFAQQWRTALIDDLDDRRVLDGTDLQVAEVQWGAQLRGDLREPDWRIERTPSPVQINETPPRLRWALKASSPGTLLGDLWGDTYFADDLAVALRGLGQQVVVDRTSSWDRPGSAGWDDVTLTLRGLQRFTPQPDAVNLLWVISHPDQVTVDELNAGWDQVYAAGPAWGAEQSLRAGIAITPLLQATDSRRFRHSATDLTRSGVLFVGRTRGERRPVVLDAAEVVSDLQVYGDDGWERYLHDSQIAGAVLSNTDLPRAYSSARVVLNDHWDDMRRGGFLSNRLFDAAAAGAKIVSDAVPGLKDVFGDQVRTYSTIDELRSLLAVDSTVWPAAEEMDVSASRVAREHSFDARARALLDDALQHRAR